MTFSMALAALAIPVQAQTLKGSPASVERQYLTAVAYGYAFFETPYDVQDHVKGGELLPVEPSRHMELHDVSYPYARNEVKLFLERLSAQYFTACSEKLVVTSLVRPQDRQPANAASNSVHPTGMAVDLRIPSKSRCRSWLEQTLLSLEANDVLDVTRERNPPHYHVALFTQSYASYLTARSQSPQEYVARPGDSLWLIASRTGTTVAQLRAANGLRSDLINVGQKLQIPATGTTLASNASRVQASNTVSEVSHRVRRGDTLWRLANQYGTSVERIQRENGLRGSQLQPGQVLRIRFEVANL
ncbi:MAG: hypothetical protein RLZZ385_820 [Pseudomonadota bacterium]|jgi:LysM repeat protein